jgi:hypothetical protein
MRRRHLRHAPHFAHTSPGRSIADDTVMHISTAHKPELPVGATRKQIISIDLRWNLSIHDFGRFVSANLFPFLPCDLEIVLSKFMLHCRKTVLVKMCLYLFNNSSIGMFSQVAGLFAEHLLAGT